MVTDLYAHINTEDRRRLAQKMEQDSFQDRKQGVTTGAASENEAAQALRLLQDNPEMAKLIIAALSQSAAT